MFACVLSCVCLCVVCVFECVFTCVCMGVYVFVFVFCCVCLCVCMCFVWVCVRVCHSSHVHIAKGIRRWVGLSPESHIQRPRIIRSQFNTDTVYMYNARTYVNPRAVLRHVHQNTVTFLRMCACMWVLVCLLGPTAFVFFKVDDDTLQILVGPRWRLWHGRQEQLLVSDRFVSISTGIQSPGRNVKTQTTSGQRFWSLVSSYLLALVRFCWNSVENESSKSSQVVLLFYVSMRWDYFLLCVLLSSTPSSAPELPSLDRRWLHFAVVGQHDVCLEQILVVKFSMRSSTWMNRRRYENLHRNRNRKFNTLLRRWLSTGGSWVRRPLQPPRRDLGQVLYL